MSLGYETRSGLGPPSGVPACGGGRDLDYALIARVLGSSRVGAHERRPGRYHSRFRIRLIFAQHNQTASVPKNVFDCSQNKFYGKL